jgi:hypothetical protein
LKDYVDKLKDLVLESELGKMNKEIRIKCSKMIREDEMYKI